MKLSVFYDHIVQAHEQSGKSISEILRFCHELGIEGLEMNYTQFSENRDGICAMLSETGMCISCFYEFFEFQKNKDLSKAKELLETAARLQISRVLFVPGTLNASEAAELWACSGDYEAVSVFMDNHPGVQNMKRALTTLTAYAASLGVTITLEDFDGFGQPFARMNQLLWFMRQVPGLRYTLDMGNFAFSDEDVVSGLELLWDYLVHVHCKDRARNPAVRGVFCKGLGSCPAGRGYLPVEKLISVLKERGYDGYLAIEHFDVPDQLSCIEESAGFLRKCAGILKACR